MELVEFAFFIEVVIDRRKFSATERINYFYVADDDLGKKPFVTWKIY